MILYLDTSALVKVYVEEPGREAVMREVERAAAVATSRVSYAEARAAFARKRREGGFDRKALTALADRLDSEWLAYTVVDVSEAVVRRAGELADKHALRGYDSVQLSSALALKFEGADVAFGCFDRSLHRAARRERFKVPVFRT